MKREHSCPLHFCTIRTLRCTDLPQVSSCKSPQEPIDVRDKKLIETDLDGGCGDLMIIKTKKPLHFIDSLIELRELLINAKNADEIEKILPLE